MPVGVARGRRDAQRAPPRRDVDDVIHGLRAGLAVFARRRDDILRVGYARAARHDAAELTRWAAVRRIPCAEMSDVDLDRLAGTTHHEGLAVVARPRTWLSTSDLAEALVRSRGAAVALDRVRNPYNVGAILRTAAFFRIDAALFGAPAPHPGVPPAAIRVAEGAVENLQLARTTDLADTLARLRTRGVHVVGADAHAGQSAIGFAFARPSVLVMGHERDGLNERVQAQCDAVVAIPGTGAVESLNVAVAAGILVCEMMRQRSKATQT